VAVEFVSRSNLPKLRLGLCCQFAREPIKLRTTTETAMLRLPRPSGCTGFAELCRHNADALMASLGYRATHGIGAFRINSRILPSDYLGQQALVAVRKDRRRVEVLRDTGRQLSRRAGFNPEKTGASRA
jgi:UV DNA damage repair endonuclease